MTWFASVSAAFSHVSLASVGAWLSDGGDIFWDASIFQSNTWTKLMNGLRVLLTMGGAMLLLYEFRAKRMSERIRERTKKRVAVVMAVLAFGTYFDFFDPNVRYREYYHRHEFYYYYLGSKFSDELGYNRLYE